MIKFYLDAEGASDGSDPTKVVRVYPDGTRVPLSEPEPELTDLRRLLCAEPEEVQTWVINNVTTLQTAKTVLALLGRAVAILAQRDLVARDGR